MTSLLRHFVSTSGAELTKDARCELALVSHFAEAFGFHPQQPEFKQSRGLDAPGVSDQPRRELKCSCQLRLVL